jgi:hypothetical protein
VVFYYAVLSEETMDYSNEEAEALCSLISMKFSHQADGYAYCEIQLANGLKIEHVYKKINATHSTLFLVNLDGYGR